MKKQAELSHAEKATKAALVAVDEIKRERKTGLITDKDIANHMGIAYQTIHYWRSGERNITVEQLCALVHVFNVNPDYLLKQKGKPFGTTGPELTDIEKRLQAVEKKLKGK